MCYYLSPVNGHVYDVCKLKVPNPLKAVNATGQLENLAMRVSWPVAVITIS